MAEVTPTTSSPTPKLKLYSGNCHCGAFKFSVSLPEIKGVMICNCSYCTKLGAMWGFPGENPFVIERGGEELKVYEFSGKKIGFKFCGTCGTVVYGKIYEGPPGHDTGINVRCIQGLDLEGLKVKEYDGAKLDPQYQHPKFKGSFPPAQIKNAKIYKGACHCGAVIMALKVQGSLVGTSADNVYIQECDCSICVRNGTILHFPRSDQIRILNADKLTGYTFGRGFQEHKFCGTCGVPVYIKKLEVTDEQWAKDGDESTTKEDWMLERAVNLRCFEGVEWDKIKVTKVNGKDVGEAYVVE